MERKAHYALIGLFTFAVIAGAFGFVYWLHHSSGKKQAVAYRVIFNSPVAGLQVGSSVLFNGIRVGEVSSLRLDPDKPSQVTALLGVNKSTPIRSDTHVSLQFTGLTGVASISLKGVSATTPLIEREEGEPPTLKADPTASQDVMQAARDALNKAENLLDSNQAALHRAIENLATFTDALARNGENVDTIMKNTKELTASLRSNVDVIMENARDATASINVLAINLDKRTEDVANGINRMTATATRQIDTAGRALTDLAHNPQRILFGGSSNSAPAPAPTPAALPSQRKKKDPGQALR
jgi:phospholipid/cholesterol/gamma-HCH transport system substrate-binding protein